ACVWWVLAEVVRKGAPLEELAIQPQLARHHPGDPGALDEVLQDVLPVGGAVAEAAEQSDELGGHVGAAERDKSVLTGADAQLVHLGPGPLMCLFDPLRVDAPVEDEAFERDSSDLTTYW